MKVPIYNLAGEKTGEIDLQPKIFEVPVHPGLIHQTVQAELANARNTVAHTKTRGEVRGGGKKPWKQKGTGRARVGSIRSPLWKGGGTIFGPRNIRNYGKKINRSQFRKSLFMTLSDKLAGKNLLILDDFPLEKIGSKAANAQLTGLLKKLNFAAKANLILPRPDKKIERSLRNVANFSVWKASEVSPYKLLGETGTIILKDALPVIEKTYQK